ncbi:hypothetical protein B7463_g576, partial [Scytalidium lignicola]
MTHDTDFGESWQPSLMARYKTHAPDLFHPPEVMFAKKQERPISFPSYVWTSGCTIYALFAKRDIFECFRSDSDDVLVENISMLGKPPQKWWDLWDAKYDFLNKNGEWDARPTRSCANEFTRLPARVDYIAEDREGSMTDEELGDLLEPFESMFRFLPEDRMSITEIANGPWMKKWGLPAFQAVQQAKNESDSASEICRRPTKH